MGVGVVSDRVRCPMISTIPGQPGDGGDLRRVADVFDGRLETVGTGGTRRAAYRFRWCAGEYRHCSHGRTPYAPGTGEADNCAIMGWAQRGHIACSGIRLLLEGARDAPTAGSRE